jgi:hypothetical protein
MREAKPDWADLPDGLREKIGTLIGEPIARAATVHGGFGPSATFVLRTAGGRKVFCKGAHPGQTDMGRAALLRERQNFETFPELAKFAPAYLGGADDGDWNVIVLEHVERAREVPPWTAETLDGAMAALACFHGATPDRARDELQNAKEDALLNLFKHEHGWASLRESSASRDRFVALFAEPAVTNRWFDANIETLSSLEAQAYGVEGPQSWIHQDIRSDNLIYAGARPPRIVDWPYLAFGPSLIDVAFFLPSVAGEHGPQPRDGLKTYERISGLRFNTDEIAIAAVVVAGFFAARAGEPEMPLLPRLRWVQRLQLFPALNWTCELLGIEPPPRNIADGADAGLW